MTTFFQLQSHKVVSYQHFISAWRSVLGSQPCVFFCIGRKFQTSELDIVDETLAFDAKKKLTKCKGMVVDIFHHDTLQRVSTRHRLVCHLPFLTKRNGDRIYWHLLAKILACSKGRKTHYCSDILRLAKNRLVTKIQLTMFSIYLESLLTVHSATTSKFMTSPMYIPQGMTALHSQECP